MLDWSAGTMSGLPYELWVGGYDEGQNAALESGNYATGYKNMKYYLGTEYQRQYTHWVYLRLSDIYLTYAEALLQAKNDHRGAIDQMNIVRARVGLKKDLAECVTDKNLLSDKAALLEELLCVFGNWGLKIAVTLILSVTSVPIVSRSACTGCSPIVWMIPVIV
mgnify:CR=1 FL=1